METNSSDFTSGGYQTGILMCIVGGSRWQLPNPTHGGNLLGAFLSSVGVSATSGDGQKETLLAEQPDNKLCSLN